MKVPHQILGRTRPTSAGMDPLRVNIDADAFGGAIGRGLGDLAQGLSMAFKQVEERDSKTNRFAAMTNYSDFEISINGKLAELKKNADPTGQGFVKTAAEAYEKEAALFLDKMVAPEVRDEARYWLSNTKQRIIGDSMNFQYEAGNAFFRTGLDKEYQNTLKSLDPALGGDPLQLPAAKAKMKAFIDATDLPEIEKAELARTTAVGLEGVVYKQAFKTSLAAGMENLPGTVGNIIDQAAARHGVSASALRRIAWIESKGNPNARNPNSSAGGLFQQIDSNARQYGVTNRFDPAQSADGAARFAAENTAYFRQQLGRDPTDSELYLMHQQGPGSAVKLLRNPNARAIDLVSADAIRLNGGNANMTAGEFAALWDRKMQGASDKLDESPVFGNLPYEDRMALRKDGEAEYNSELAAQAEADKFRINTLTNDLLNKINDGLAGQTEIDAARADWLTDYDTINKAQTLYEKRNGEVNLVNDTLGRLASGSTFDPTSEDDRKGLNAVVGKRGLARIDGMDQAYFSNGIVPLVTQSQDIPTDVAGLLTGMIRSNNQEKGLWAFDALALLQDQAPEAFNNRIPDDVASSVNFYRNNRTSLPADQLFERLNGGTTQAERQGRALLYQEAQDNLKTKKEGVATLSTLVQDVVSGYDGWTASAEQIASPAFAKQLTFDYESAYIDYYTTRKPDHDEAAAWATKQIQRDWAVSEAGGGILMKHPPELVGYPKVMDSHEWIGQQAKELLQLGPEDRYQLISDDKTASELVKFRQGLGPPPSYQVVTFDASGTPRLRMFFRTDGPKGEEVLVETNNPARIRFEKTPAHKAVESLDFELKNVTNKLIELDQEMVPYQGLPESEIPADLRQEWDDLMRQRDAIGTQYEELTKRPAPKREEMKGLVPQPRGPLPFMINRAKEFLGG